METRGFNTEYETHLGLIHNFARKGYGRLLSANIGIDYDDVFQHMSMTYCKVLQKYDATRGVTFTAYLGRAIWNEFNRYAEKLEQQNHFSCRITHSDDNNEIDEMECVVDDHQLTPEENLERKQEIVGKLRELSPHAKFVVAQLIAPSPELIAGFELYRADIGRKKEAGTAMRSVTQITIGFIGRHFDMKPQRIAAISRELKQVYDY